MSLEKINLLDLSFDSLQKLVEELGQPKFRALQIWEWLYCKYVFEPEKMVNLPKEFRIILQEKTYANCVSDLKSLESKDKLTKKVLLKTLDDHSFESVLMHYTERHTVCASCQIGCPVACSFCATGKQKFIRNLSVGEITAQILYFMKELKQEDSRVTNIVFMGMGEPMLNFDAVWQSILNLNHSKGMNIGFRRFTISTSGIVPGIERMAKEAKGIGLAISLHAPENKLRNELVPINSKYPLEVLMSAVKLYLKKTKRRVSFEYVLLKDINDSDAHARKTADLLSNLLCHVNLIPFNVVKDCKYEPSSLERITRFKEILEKRHIEVTARLARGLDINAGCGQLKENYSK